MRSSNIAIGALLVVLRGYLMIIEWRNARRERAIVRIEDC